MAYRLHVTDLRKVKQPLIDAFECDHGGVVGRSSASHSMLLALTVLGHLRTHSPHAFGGTTSEVLTFYFARFTSS
jgi:hypothetical protein